MKNATPFINRELSWLEFNQRVLNEAQRESLPLLERLKFLAITSSNLDEFFQVRVGGLQLLRSSGLRPLDIAGLTPYQQLRAIRQRATTMIEQQYDLLNDELLPSLKKEGIELLHPRELSSKEKDALHTYFQDNILPVLTPLALDTEDRDPVLLPDLRMILAVELRNEKNEQRIVCLPLPTHLPRFVPLPYRDHSQQEASASPFIALEDIVAFFANELFEEEKVYGSLPFRITRNGDIALEEEDAIDLAEEMEDLLIERKRSKTVRLELPSQGSRFIKNTLKEYLDTSAFDTYHHKGPLCLKDFMSLSFLDGFDHLRDPSWSPQPSPMLEPSISLFDTLNEKDILLHHPYESFEPIIQLLEEAAKDPHTLAIKQVLYRTASHSRIIDALIKAAQAGKQVTVLIELKARFDEARNLLRAEELQRAGVQIIYGVKGLKTHAKICLVIRNEHGQLRRYVHLGTGNYNESTAKLYTDISYLTSHPAYGADASHIFNAITGRSRLARLQKIIPAPTHMKPRLLALIAAEAQRAKEGEKAQIIAKVNSLQDKAIIEALYKASECGVKIKLNVRGICCLKTGKTKHAKNIKVVSVIDRYLEHSRIFCFHHGGDPLFFIASADWMTRNLDKRVELMVPIEDKASVKKLSHILESAFKDNSNAFEIQPDGSSLRRQAQKGEDTFRLQAQLYAEAKKLAQAKRRERSTTFEPHTPPSL